MKKSRLIAPALFLSLTLVMAGCAPGTDSSQNTAGTDNTGSTQAQGSQQKMNMEPQTPPDLTAEQSQQLEDGASDHSPKTLTFTVDGGNFYFVPNMIKVKKGDTVIINFKNDGGKHDFILDEFNLTTEPSMTPEVTPLQFVADKAGTFEYYCNVGKHRQMGMKGTLIVE